MIMAAIFALASLLFADCFVYYLLIVDYYFYCTFIIQLATLSFIAK